VRDTHAGPRIGRSVYFMLKNQEAFDMNRFFA
jgi:hypothetical protein